jgi:hypothetical protein
MPDIQTALKSALSRTLQEWDDDGETSPQPSTINTTITNSVSAPSQAPTMTNLFNVTNNVSRSTFNYIKDNPGSTRQEIIIALEHTGFTKSSVAALISQMNKAKMIHKTNDLWYVDVPEYIPIKNTTYVKKKAKVEKKTTGSTGIGALLKAKLENRALTHDEAMDVAAYAMGGQEQTPPIVPTRKGFVSLVRNRTPESIIDNMTVYQARELYDHLKKLFGG